MSRSFSTLSCLIALFFCFQLCHGKKRLLVNDADYMDTKLKTMEASLRQEFSSEMSKLRQEYEGKLVAMNNTISMLQSTVKETKHHVAFYATLSSHKTLGQEQTVEYDKVITNIGGAYSGVSGVFTVPIDGIYHLSTSMFSTGATTLHTQVMLNSKPIGNNYGNSHAGSGTINILISAAKGDLMYVRHMTGLPGETMHGSGYSSFSGFLVE